MTPVGRSSRLRPASEVSARFLSAGGFGYELLLSDDFETCESSRLLLATCEAHWLSARPATLLSFLPWPQVAISSIFRRGSEARYGVSLINREAFIWKKKALSGKPRLHTYCIYSNIFRRMQMLIEANCQVRHLSQLFLG